MHEIFLFVMNIIIIVRFITLRSLILFYIYYVGHTTLAPYVSKLTQLKKSCFSSTNLIYLGEKVFDR